MRSILPVEGAALQRPQTVRSVLERDEYEKRGIGSRFAGFEGVSE